ncbi:DUF6960 family protein [Clostridium polynesiense]|uniref:DUF6960 family protein n=1 Tax=Clostridium polynesiense TaxID=1325933 RepID=UPI000590649D|nr:hypothetical protein [Clostridium polynesiense]
MSYINTWGVYQAFQGIDDDMIDIDDRMNFFGMIPNGKIFECVNAGENLTLRYGDKEFRVNPQLYKVVNEPKYKIGDKVNIISKSKIVKITDINWHIKENTPFYFVQEDGKKSTRRYYESELEKLDEL